METLVGLLLFLTGYLGMALLDRSDNQLVIDRAARKDCEEKYEKQILELRQSAVVLQKQLSALETELWIQKSKEK